MINKKLLATTMAIAMIGLTGCSFYIGTNPNRNQSSTEDKNTLDENTGKSVSEGENQGTSQNVGHSESEDDTSISSSISQSNGNSSDGGFGIDESKLTENQKNLYDSAMNYLESSYSSRENLANILTDQNTGDSNDVEIALSMVEINGVDWKDQAIDAAEGYLNLEKYDKASLKEQLISGDLFTVDEAEYAVSVVLGD